MSNEGRRCKRGGCILKFWFAAFAVLVPVVVLNDMGDIARACVIPACLFGAYISLIIDKRFIL
jgi:hypothetical protein